jgi:hypothetical protein
MIFPKHVEKIQMPLKSDGNKYFIPRPIYIYIYIYIAQFFLEWEMFQVKMYRMLQLAFYVQKVFVRKSCPLRDNVEKNMVQRQTPQMTNNRKRITKKGTCNTYCFSAPTMAAGGLHNATLYVLCLTCFQRLQPSSHVSPIASKMCSRNCSHDC